MYSRPSPRRAGCPRSSRSRLPTLEKLDVSRDLTNRCAEDKDKLKIIKKKKRKKKNTSKGKRGCKGTLDRLLAFFCFIRYFQMEKKNRDWLPREKITFQQKNPAGTSEAATGRCSAVGWGTESDITCTPRELNALHSDIVSVKVDG